MRWLFSITFDSLDQWHLAILIDTNCLKLVESNGIVDDFNPNLRMHAMFNPLVLFYFRSLSILSAYTFKIKYCNDEKCNKLVAATRLNVV